MGLFGRFTGEKNLEATAEQPAESTENVVGRESRESPEKTKEGIQATLAGALRNKLNQAKAVASLRIGGMSPRTRGIVVMAAVIATTVIVSGAADFDVSRFDNLADIVNPGDIGHGHDHVLANTGFESDAGGSSVTVEVPAPTPTPESTTNLNTDHGGNVGSSDLLNRGAEHASDDKVKELMRSMEDYSKHHSGKTNIDVTPVPPTENPTPVPTETPAPTTEVPNPAPTETPTPVPTETPVPTIETPTTPVREVANLSGPKPNMVNLDIPTPDTAHLGNPETPDTYIVP